MLIYECWNLKKTHPRKELLERIDETVGSKFLIEHCGQTPGPDSRKEKLMGEPVDWLRNRLVDLSFMIPDRL